MQSKARPDEESGTRPVKGNEARYARENMQITPKNGRERRASNTELEWRKRETKNDDALSLLLI